MQEAEPLYADDLDEGAPITGPEGESLRARVRDNYLKVLRKMVPRRGSRVRLSTDQIAKHIEWSKGKGSLVSLL